MEGWPVTNEMETVWKEEVVTSIRKVLLDGTEDMYSTFYPDTGIRA